MSWIRNTAGANHVFSQVIPSFLSTYLKAGANHGHPPSGINRK
jgi:hypothetical protein